VVRRVFISACAISSSTSSVGTTLVITVSRLGCCGIFTVMLYTLLASSHFFLYSSHVFCAAVPAVFAGIPESGHFGFRCPVCPQWKHVRSAKGFLIVLSFFCFRFFHSLDRLPVGALPPLPLPLFPLPWFPPLCWEYFFCNALSSSILCFLLSLVFTVPFWIE
jgi:hypothetical protein